MEEVFEKEEKNEVTKRIKKPSRLRRTIPQICAMIPENFTLLAIGLFVGFITIVIAGLTNNTMNISADKTDISWIGESSIDKKIPETYLYIVYYSFQVPYSKFLHQLDV